MDEHTFHVTVEVKIEAVSVPVEFIPGSPAPFELVDALHKGLLKKKRRNRLLDPGDGD